MMIMINKMYRVVAVLVNNNNKLLDYLELLKVKQHQFLQVS
jgi:hypothetical protein